MIRSAKQFTESNMLAQRALESCAEIIRNYATHRDSRCVDGSIKCECGLSTFQLIAEARMIEFRESLRDQDG